MDAEASSSCRHISITCAGILHELEQMKTNVSCTFTAHIRCYSPVFHDACLVAGEEKLMYSSFGASCSEVEVNMLTGERRVLRADIMMDAGNSLSPAIDAGQVTCFGLFNSSSADLSVSFPTSHELSLPELKFLDNICLASCHQCCLGCC